ncbi:MAG: MerR family transcriptional regulator [Oscillospiraceae bacterium]|nr:MerR family transcriptional regulator [Oscillospiraceae bacterium]
MKTNTLSNLSGVNAETIRKYRDRSLLRPACNPENGYYEYSQADFLNLLYIRKLRGANLSIDSIEGTYECEESEPLCREYEKTLEDLQKQIRQLKRKEMMLRVTYRHYERDAASTGKISVIQSFGTKYDLYFDRDQVSRDLALWIRNVDLFTMVINIKREFFEAESLPERIPFRIGMGTYQEVLEEEKIAIPEQAAVFPEGRYVSFFLEIDNLESFESAKLDKVRQYLRENSLQPDSDTTAYLYRVTFADTGYHFHFCVRLRVK